MCPVLSLLRTVSGYIYKRGGAIISYMPRTRFIECRRCDEEFDPDREVPIPADPLRCPMCGQIHYEEEARTRTPEIDGPDVFEQKVQKRQVYAIRSGSGEIKIGISVDPQRRLSSLQTASPTELELLATANPDSAKAVETAIHNQFDQYQTTGEWFELPEAKREALVSELSNW